MFLRTITLSILALGAVACSKPAMPAAATSAAPVESSAKEAGDPNAKLDGDLTFASTTPFWHGSVTGSNHAMTVVRPMRDDDLVGKPVAKIEADKASFTGTTAKDGDMTLTVERKPCRPSAKEPMWPFSSTLTIEGNTYKGCASPGSPHIPG